MKHTPGPWSLDLNNNPREVGDDNYVLSANGWQFAKFNDESLACGFDACTPAANAHLIAAAPELLEALKRVRHAFYVDGKAKALRAAFEGTKELVAKAEGRLA